MKSLGRELQLGLRLLPTYDDAGGVCGRLNEGEKDGDEYSEHRSIRRRERLIVATPVMPECAVETQLMGRWFMAAW